jgi:hypothetical protein
MNRIFHIVFFIAVMLSLASTSTMATQESDKDKDKKDKAPPKFLDNVPPWETYEQPPSVIFSPPPIYVRRDENGNVVSKQIRKRESGGYEVTEKIIPLAVLNRASAIRHIIYLDDEDTSPDDQQSPSGPTNLEALTCPIPESWTITIIDDDTVIGGESALDTSKPVDANTQWMSFDFYTEDYRAIGSHMALPLWFTDALYGWGALVGDNSGDYTGGSYRGCGEDMPYTSQIEGYNCLEDDLGTRACKNAVYNGPDSCGVEYFDGPAYTEEGEEVPRYRFEMQASEGHTVAYLMGECKFLMGGTDITGWKSLNVDTQDYFPCNEGNENCDGESADWSTPSQGIFIGATNAALGYSGIATINIFNVRCGWF